MADVSRRTFGKRTLLLSCLTALSLPGTARAFFDKVKKDTFLKRDDVGNALKSYYMTYDCTSPYPHKFNEVVTKQQMRSLQFYIDHNIEKEYIQHYLDTKKPWLQELRQLVEKEGAEKGLVSMFDDNPSAYQLFERIDAKPGQRTFPCPYKELLVQCKKYLKTFTIEWNDVCNKWCTPTWKGVAGQIGIDITVAPGETCSVTLNQPQQSQGGEKS